MNTHALITDFAIRSFRDVADHDYIVARMAYRVGLVQQFHWSSLQAIEKYLKAILLLNRIEARDVKHDLSRALHYAKQLPFTIELSESSRRFIQHLDRFGRFRYLESSFWVHGPKLVELDRAVWEIRRYCRVLRHMSDGSRGSKHCMLTIELARIDQSKKRPSHKFRIIGGVLEKVLDDRRNLARRALVWQNAFFGERRRRKVAVPTYFQAVNAPLTLHPEILDEVLKYVYLPKEVVDAHRKRCDASDE